MSKDLSFHDKVMTHLFQDIPGITSRAMFGGFGIYKDGYIFALIAENELYFKVDAENLHFFEKAKSNPFVYEKEGSKPTAMSYWLLPQEVRKDKKQLLEWIYRSVEASKRAKKKK